MKKFYILLLAALLGSPAIAQQELHIHHINVEDGDATFIGIYNTALHKYTSKILIDGGDQAPAKYLLPYLNRVAKGTDAVPHLDAVILTHYHHDHLFGLTALATGAMTADSLIDPSGYDLKSIFAHQNNLQSAAEATPAHLAYNMDAWLVPVKAAADHGYIKGHSMRFRSFGTSAQSGIGQKMTIGTVNGLPVTLQCVAGWGNTESGNGIVPLTIPSPYSPNDYTLGFILSCGQFRYFIGGDMGGSNSGEYIDQESSLTGFLNKMYPISHGTGGTAQGHICGFKADHHGSAQSNSQAFISGMKPAITVTSAGSKSSWHLPSVPYLQHLGQVNPLSSPATGHDSTYNRGVYFTNLQNFPAGASLDVATQLFAAHPGVSFDYGNAQAGEKAGYMVRVSGTHLATASTFQVYRADLRQPGVYTLLADYKCHDQ